MSQERSHGMMGGRVIADTVVYSQDCFCVDVIADAVFNVTGTTFESIDPLDDFDDLNGVTIPAGASIYGNFTAVQLASGTVVAYKR